MEVRIEVYQRPKSQTSIDEEPKMILWEGKTYTEPERNNIVHWFLSHRSGTNMRGDRTLVWEGICGTIPEGGADKVMI